LKRKAIFLLYRVLQALASPAVSVYLLFRGVKNPGYPRTLGERLGAIPSLWQQTVAGSIWLHAVSVGEVLAAVPLLEELRGRTPGTPVFVSTSTLAGRETAEKRLGGLTAGVFYAPLDFVWSVRRVLRRLKPSVVVIFETEIWPNLFRESKRLGCGLILVNGRISDRALPRYRRFAPLFSVVLELCDKILVQSEEMSSRFAEAGAPPERISVAGNLKYDFKPASLAADSPLRKFIDAAPDAPLWIAASTSADDRIEEETFVLAAQKALPGWRLIIAPRKPERFERVAAMIERAGFRWTRRTALDDPSADVLLLDSIGELSAVFASGTVVFMGGTLADRGGHNVLEPAVFGKPVVVGPHLENFRDIAEHFDRARAMLRIDSGDRLGEAVLAAAADPGLGERARVAAAAERGASGRAADCVLALYESTYPADRDPQPLFGFLWFLALIWKYASARDRRRKTARARKLPVPVVSVGNITTGGTGKTPITIGLLRTFRDCQPGMLTRGHGRASHGNVIYRPADVIPVSITGDEPQLCMLAAKVPIGIGGDRYAVGRELLDSSNVRMLILDDGFQHLQLARDFDLVLIDALHPFGGGDLVPLGRLREPLEGLSRAYAFVITRADEVPGTKAIESVLRRYNPGAPVFRAVTVPWAWHGGYGRVFDPLGLPIANERVVAFCGLGNPQAFWKTLRSLGIRPEASYDFGDHHRYSPSELRRLARHARDVGAKVLLTTAKDAVNLEPDYMDILGGVKLYWLEIKAEIEGADELSRLIRSKIGLAP
jgi:3-deoxy-D-manno-octulosonic-acid transferase